MVKQVNAMYSIYDTCILLVDNDINFLNEVDSLLKEAGFQQVIKANQCEDAIEMCKSSSKPYLIIMEYNFKVMTGPELITEIKKYYEKIKLIVLSDSTEISDAFKSFEFGALSFVHKNDTDWDKTIVDSVRTWIDFYRNKEFTRTEFRAKLKTLTV